MAPGRTGVVRLQRTTANVCWEVRRQHGRVILNPVVDSSEVDVRRAHLGLPPLAAYVRMLDSAYGHRSNP